MLSPSTFVAIKLDSGRRHQVWGVGLEKATVETRTERRQVRRNCWRITAEKFRATDRQAAARDGELVAAQSLMAIIERALECAFPEDERARQRIRGAVKERIAQHLENGHFVCAGDSPRTRSGSS